MDAAMATNSTSSSEIKKCFVLLEEGEKIIKTDQKDAILVLGNTGSGKTTLVQFLAGDNSEMVAEEAASGTGDYVIVDKKNKISSDSTIVSKTIFPDLIIDQENNVGIFDCPGFVDTRGAAIDIAGTYFIRKVVNSIERVKIILTVNDTSVKKGVDRGDFLEMIRQVLSLIKNIDNYSDGVAIVVTKVDNSYVKNKKTKQPELVPDDVIKEAVVKFLEMFRTSVAKVAAKSLSDKAVTLVDALLTKNGTNYERIGIFRRPDGEGPLSKNELMQEGKRGIKKLLFENIQYVRVNQNDFGYAISDKSKNEVKDMIEEINKTIKTCILEICAEIEESIENRHKQATDIGEFKKFLTNVQEQMSQFKETLEFETSLKNFTRKFLILIADLRVNASRNRFLDMLKQGRYLDFLELVSERKVEGSSLQWKEGFHQITDYLREMQEWYSFLIRLHDRFSSYEIQKSKLTFSYLMEHDITSFSDDKWKLFMKSQPDFFNVTNVQQPFELDDVKILSLNNIISSTLNTSMHIEYDSEFSSRDIYGDIIILSQIEDDNLLNSKVTTIFATNKIFIDKNITRRNDVLTNFAIIAPTWEVIGVENIILNGSDGPLIPTFHDDDRIKGSNGDDGKPGLAGKPGANFFGVFNNIINSENLSVFANGGWGGPGQNGTDGAPGLDGESPRKYYHDGCRVESLDWFSWNYQNGFLFNKEYCSYGRPGTNGGNGGNGGVGGLGGYPGDIALVSLHDYKPLTTVLNKRGPKGVDGQGGEAGFGGRAGKSMNTKGSLFWWDPLSCEQSERLSRQSGIKCSENDYLRNGSPGQNGYPGVIRSPLREPIHIESPDNAVILRKYKEFLRRRLMLDNVNREEKIELLAELNKESSLTKVFTTIDLVNEFIALENDYLNLTRDFDWLSQYEQLLRIVELHSSSSKEEQLVLKFLQKSIISKLCLLKVHPQKTLITQVTEYLDSLNVDLSQFQRGEGQMVMNDTHEKLKFQIIQTISELKDRFGQNHDQVSNMINVVRENVEKTLLEMVSDAESKNRDEKQLTLEQNLILLKILYGIGEINLFLGAVGDFGAGIVEAARSPNKYLIQKDEYAENISQIQEILLRPFQSERKLMQEQLGYISTNNIVTDEKLLNSITNFQSSSKDPDSLNTLFEKKKIVRNLLSQVKKADGEKPESFQTTLQTVEVILQLKDASMVITGDATTANRAKILSDTIHNSSAYDQVQFYIDKLLSTSEQFLSELSGHLLDEIVDVTRVSKQKTFEDMNLLLQQLQKSAKLPEDLLFIFQRMQMDMKVINKIYDSLTYYQELERMVALMNDFHPPKSSLNIQYKNTVDNLQVMTESNLVSGLYQVMLKNMQQIVFPFGKMYTDEFDLFGNNHKNITNYAAYKMQSMRSAIEKQGLYLDTDHTKLVFDGEFTNRENALGAFYVWRNQDHKIAIKDLLAGKEVTLKADIVNGVPNDAVKFSSIRIKFACKNEILQSLFDENLSSFEVTMIHGGDSYYRCGNEFYVFTFDRQTLSFSYRRKENGEPEYKNSTYGKIKTGATILSPYTQWSIQLKGNNFDKLARYKDLIDLELEGEGIWVKEGKNICGTALRNYYTLDNTISETNAVENDFMDLSRVQLQRQNENITTTMPQLHRIPRSLDIQKIEVEEPPMIFPEMTAKPLLEHLNANSRIAMANNGDGEIDFWSPASYNLDKGLLLLDLLVRRVTRRKPTYLAPCPTNYLNARFCALDVVKHFERIVEDVSDYPGQFDFDPVLLMEQLEKDIIKENGKNVGEILLKVVQNNDSPTKDKFFGRLQAEIEKKYSLLQKKTA